MSENVFWNKTAAALNKTPQERISYRKTTDLHYLDGKRHIIGRNTPINGGAYIGQSTLYREILIIEDSKDETLRDSYHNFLMNLFKEMKGKKISLINFVPAQAMIQANEIFKTDDRAVDSLVNQYGGANTKIILGIFMQHKIGMCRHRAALIAYWIEKLIADGYLDNCSVSMDRNFIEGRGGHAWTRLTTADEFIVIIDAAQGYIGPPANPFAPWDYLRPEE